MEAKKQLRKPENWDDFENLCKKLWGEIWECKEIKKNGRKGQNQNGKGIKHTAKRLPVELVYFEEFNRIDEAFYKEKQVQGWSREKKESLKKLNLRYCTN